MFASKNWAKVISDSYGYSCNKIKITNEELHVLDAYNEIGNIG